MCQGLRACLNCPPEVARISTAAAGGRVLESARATAWVGLLLEDAAAALGSAPKRPIVSRMLLATC